MKRQEPVAEGVEVGRHSRETMQVRHLAACVQLSPNIWLPGSPSQRPLHLGPWLWDPPGEQHPASHTMKLTFLFPSGTGV